VSQEILSEGEEDSLLHLWQYCFKHNVKGSTMFGFSKSNLSTGEATYLLLALLHMHLLGYVEHNENMSSELSSRLIRLWLHKHGRSAGFMYRAKMSSAGDAMFLHFVATQVGLTMDQYLEHIEDAVVNPGDYPGLVADSVIVLCRAFVIKWGLAAAQ
jgi:hypothetical protein